MTTTTALLPTSPLAVEDWLRSLANPSELLKMRENGESEYPYLFGLATVKLAEAHREYLRLVERQAAKGGVMNIYELHDSISCRWSARRQPSAGEIIDIQSELRATESNARLTLYRNGIPVRVFGADYDGPLSPAEVMAAHLAEFGR